MKKPRQQLLRVRVDYEPNRFSGNCLEKIYEQLNPTKSREVTPAKNGKQDEVEPQKGRGGQR